MDTSTVHPPLFSNTFVPDKGVQFSKLVGLSETHSLIYKVVTKYSNRTYTWSLNTLVGQSGVLFRYSRFG